MSPFSGRQALLATALPLAPALLLAPGLAGPVAAQRAPAPAADSADAPVFELREIVASAAGPVSEAAATARVIDGERMRATGARTLDQALALVAGVGVRTGSEGVPRVEMRGFRPREILVLLDGVPLNSTYDGQPDLSLIPVDRIAWVKIISGTASVLYGEALGGVIEVVTREGAAGLRGEAGAEARSGPSRRARLGVEGGSARVRFFGAGSASADDAFPARPALDAAIGPRQNSARDWASGLAKVTLSGRRGRLGLLLTGGTGSYGLPPSDVSNASDPFASRPVYDRVDRLATGSLQLSGATGDRTLSLRGWSFLNAQDERSARYDDSTYAGMTNPANKGTFRQEARTRLAGMGLQGSWATGASRLTLALMGERDGWSVSGVIRDQPVSSGGGTGTGSGAGKGSGGGTGTPSTWAVRPLTGERELGRVGAAAEWELTPRPALGLSLGAGEHTLLRDSAAPERATALAAGARWDAPLGLRLRASAARKFRFPTIGQLYDADGGNPGLGSERATELELGAARPLGGSATLHLDAFRSDVRGFINRSAPGEALANRGLLRFEGVETTLETRPAARLALNGALSYLRTRDLSPGGGGLELQYTPRLRALMDVRWQPFDGTTAALTVARVLHQVYYSRQTPLQVGRLPDYTLLGARLARRIAAGRLEAYLGGENLLDVAWQDQYGFPRPARTLYAGLAVR